MPISLNSPNPENIVRGAGKMSVKFLDGTPDPDWVRVGNTTKFDWTPELETVHHFDQQEGEKAVDRTDVTSKSAKVSWAMEEQTAKNMSILLMSTPTIVGNHAHMEIFSDHVKAMAIKFESTNTRGPKWTYIFNRVEVLPTNTLSMFGGDYVPLEVEGTSVRVAGSFGTADADFVDVIPANLMLPQIGTDGSPVVGETVISWQGAWSGSPATYAYQWKRGGVAIVGATGTTYTLVGADSGTNLSLSVTATNGAGSVTATSANVAIP